MPQSDNKNTKRPLSSTMKKLNTPQPIIKTLNIPQSDYEISKKP